MSNPQPIISQDAEYYNNEWKYVTRYYSKWKGETSDGFRQRIAFYEEALAKEGLRRIWTDVKIDSVFVVYYKENKETIEDIDKDFPFLCVMNGEVK